MNIVLSFAISILVTLSGVVYQHTHPMIWDMPHITLGTISFPSSLDALTNPGATDSVSTVSHSAQHSNENDAIEALEAKLGIGASTPVTDSVLAGTSAGVSSWSNSPMLTNILTSASSTFQNITFLQSTSTNATTTNHFSTVASSTSFFGAGLAGAGCTGTNILQWSGGKFTCAAAGAAGAGALTTTILTANQATTTVTLSTAYNNCDLTFSAPNMLGTGNLLKIVGAFNFATDGSANGYSERRSDNDANTTQTGQWFELSYNANSNRQLNINAHITNLAGAPKYFHWDSLLTSTSSLPADLGGTTQITDGHGIWASTTQATSFSIWAEKDHWVFGTSTTITTFCY